MKIFKFKTLPRPLIIHLILGQHLVLMRVRFTAMLRLDLLIPQIMYFGASYNVTLGFIYGLNNTRSYLAGSFNSWSVSEVEVYELQILQRQK